MVPNKALTLAFILAILVALGAGFYHMAKQIQSEGAGFDASVQNLTTIKTQNSWRQSQLQNGSVEVALQNKEEMLREVLKRKGVSYPPARVYLRAFNDTRELELWVGAAKGEAFETLIKSYKLCASDDPRAKRAPPFFNGLYEIKQFYPKDFRYTMALKVDLPNAVDTELLKVKPTKDVGLIRGGCANTGAYHLGYEGIQEIYVLAMEARAQGQQHIPVHLFPTRMTEEGMKKLKRTTGSQRRRRAVYAQMKQMYDHFEETHTLLGFQVDPSVGYVLPPPASTP